MRCMDVEEAVEKRLLPSPQTRRSLRAAAELTLTDMAEILGVSKSSVSRWERGLRRPRSPVRQSYIRLLRHLEEHDGG